MENFHNNSKLFPFLYLQLWPGKCPTVQRSAGQKKKKTKKKWICLNIERGVKLSACNISHIFLTKQPEFIHQVPWKKSSQAWACNLCAHICVYVLRITKEQAGKLAFHSHISCQQGNNGNKVMAILKSQARSQTEAVCVTAFIHSCTQAHCGHIRVKLISIPQETSGEFQLGWYMRSGSLKKMTFHLSLSLMLMHIRWRLSQLSQEAIFQIQQRSQKGIS